MPKKSTLLSLLSVLVETKPPRGNDDWLLSYAPCWVWENIDDIWIPGIATSYEEGTTFVDFDSNYDQEYFLWQIVLGLNRDVTRYCYNYVTHKLKTNIHPDTKGDANFTFF